MQVEVISEVNELILIGVKSGRTMAASWIAEEILQKHPHITGEDKDFYILCAISHIRAVVRKCMRTFDDETERGEFSLAVGQLTLPGYIRIHKAYLIERDKEQVIVPIADCTAPEIKVKIESFRTMARGCSEHADELERYLEQRTALLHS